MTHWVGPGEVRQYALVKWDSLNYSTNTPFNTESDFDEFLTTYLIPRAQGHINAYCNRDFDTDYPLSTIPETIRDICARVASNMIQYMVMNRMGPLIKVADYKISMPKQEVITPELAKLLDDGGWVSQSSYPIPVGVTRWGDYTE